MNRMRLSGDDLFDRLMGGYSRSVVELRTEYHRQLGEIDAAVMRMFTVVEEDIGATAAAFLHCDDMAAATVEGHDEVMRICTPRSRIWCTPSWCAKPRSPGS